MNNKFASRKFAAFVIATGVTIYAVGFGQPEYVNVVSTFLLMAGAYAGIQGWNDNTQIKKG